MFLVFRLVAAGWEGQAALGDGLVGSPGDDRVDGCQDNLLSSLVEVTV